MSAMVTEVEKLVVLLYQHAVFIGMQAQGDYNVCVNQ